MSRRLWVILCERRTQHDERCVFWGRNSAGYTDDHDEAGRYTDAQALDVAERMNGGGDSPVRLIPLDAIERFTEEHARRRARATP